MKLHFYNTISHKKEIFKPLKKGVVGLYTCGPTVYHYQHIGNYRTYIFEDILRRMLVENGFRVKHIMNITDVGHLTSDEDSGEKKKAKQHGILRGFMRIYSGKTLKYSTCFFPIKPYELLNTLTFKLT